MTVIFFIQYLIFLRQIKFNINLRIRFKPSIINLLNTFMLLKIMKFNRHHNKKLLYFNKD
jgi:hypothetical protein